jgi:hypothetical protein
MTTNGVDFGTDWWESANFFDKPHLLKQSHGLTYTLVAKNCTHWLPRTVCPLKHHSLDPYEAFEVLQQHQMSCHDHKQCGFWQRLGQKSKVNKSKQATSQAEP